MAITSVLPTIRPESVSAYKSNTNKFIGNGHLIGSSLKVNDTSSARSAIGPVAAFPKSAIGKTDVSFDI